MGLREMLNGLAKEVTKVARVSPPSPNVNLSPYGDLERVTLCWRWVRILNSGDPTRSAFEDFQFPLPYNPTTFKVDRKPLFLKRRAKTDYLTGADGSGNTLYKEGSSVLSMSFMLDDTEEVDPNQSVTLAALFGALISSEKKDVNRVFLQMELLATLAEPMTCGEPHFEVVERGDTPWEFTKDIKDLKTLIPEPRILNHMSKHPKYSEIERKATGVTVVWGPFVFAGTVRSIGFNVVAADSNGMPRRVNVSLTLKGDAFTQQGRKYRKTPGAIVEKPPAVESGQTDEGKDETVVETLIETVIETTIVEEIHTQ